MTRKKFIQDLERAKDDPPTHITNVDRYDGDGVSLTYWYLDNDNVRKEVSLKAITTNVDEYPEGNQFVIFTEDADVDCAITDAFAHIQAIIDGSSIRSALREISEALHQACTLGRADNPILSSSSGQILHGSGAGDFDGDDQDEDSDDASFGLDDCFSKKPGEGEIPKPNAGTDRPNYNATKLDLLSAKDAGFKIGVHGDLTKAGIVCVSTRIAKLGISEEAMQAWGLQRNQYLVLLIHFDRGYKSLAQMVEEKGPASSVEMHVCLCDSYKPTMEEALAALHQNTDDAVFGTARATTQLKNPGTGSSIHPLFIGRPLNDLLRERFFKIVHFRHLFKLHWSGAERLFNDRQGTLHNDLAKDLASYMGSKDSASTRALPELVTQDALSHSNPLEASLPLVAMQFVLRHLVRCTEFCLVCHCQLESTFEALKPYVCTNPLCLFQFLALGFGPAAEWEILSQPYVVDLLISFCYAQARAARIKEFPVGVGLKVPVLPSFKNLASTPAPRYHVPQATQGDDTKSAPEPTRAFKAHFSSDKKTITVVTGSRATSQQTVSDGDWIILVPSLGSHGCIYHCRVIDCREAQYLLGTVVQRTADSPSLVPLASSSNAASPPDLEVDCYLYNTNFDELPDRYRCHAICCLLDVVPSVNNMRDALAKQQQNHRDANLNCLRKQCPQSSLDLLRWIVASNRSCIMQVDEVSLRGDASKTLKPSEDRVSGMDEWMQFRFAQGAPDKEQRFVDCVKAQSSSTKYPTLFAWHGSPMHNWHSIIRQGLNYDEIIHGRASGNGVYMSPWVQTSMSYTQVVGFGSYWPESLLKASNVVSLQEVVNSPQKFVSTSPHFVVAEKDWIQTRYLFVKTALRHSTGSAAKTLYQQDPLYTAKGVGNASVLIPITAISKAWRPDEDTSSLPKKKKRKVLLQEVIELLDNSDDGISIATDEADRDLLSFDQEGLAERDGSDVLMVDADDSITNTTNRPRSSDSLGKAKKRNRDSNGGFILDSSETDFVPGALDTGGISFLDPPKYASVMATKALMRAFNDTVKVQENTPLHELGFYIDPNRMENMYQWIIELHSFEKSLPLAQDMTKAGITSIVVEMQFTEDFPFSPPFVRVVKPRFLDPMAGGGGHITSGGAICMELLTTNGWSAVNSIESVLLQVRLAMSERERPARLLSNRGGYVTNSYALGEAIAAYKRFCAKHGWSAPKGLDRILSG